MNKIKKSKEIEFIKAIKNLDNKDHCIKLFDKIGKHIKVLSDDNEKCINDLKIHIQCFFQEALKLNTVSFLFGTGSSIPIGAESIVGIPPYIESQIEKKGLKKTHKRIIKCFKNNKNFENYFGELIKLKSIYERFYMNSDTRIVKLDRKSVV